MAHPSNIDQAAALRAARREQRRIAIFNQPHCYKLAPLEMERPSANDDAPILPAEKAAGV